MHFNVKPGYLKTFNAPGVQWHPGKRHSLAVSRVWTPVLDVPMMFFSKSACISRFGEHLLHPRAMPVV